MKVEREIHLGVPRDRVWSFLWDVPRLAACIPGAREVRAIEDGKRYAAVVADKLGPFRVQFPLEIEVLEASRPRGFAPGPGGGTPGWTASSA